MDYTLSELIDINELHSLCELFSQLTGFVTAILDMEGNVVIATGWQDVCTRFHRKNRATADRCRESDIYLSQRIRKGERYTLYRCKNGLYDVAVPIIIAGRQLGTLYSGQFLFTPPDLSFFRRQADECGFEKEPYLEAVARIPVVSEHTARQAMEFLSHLAEMIGRIGLANKNARLASQVVENSQVALFRWKPAEGSPMLYVSRNVIQFGYSPEEFLSGRITYEGMIHPEDLNRVQDEIQIFSNGVSTTFQLEYRIVTRDGATRWIDDRTFAERNSDGAAVFLQRAIIDITRRKEAELALQFTQFAIDHTRDAAYWTGPDGRFLYVNEASCRALGYTREEFLTMAVPDIRPEFPWEVWPAHWEELRKRKTYSFETIQKRKDGSTFPVEITVNHMFFGGREYNCAFARDISERKRAEGELIRAQKLESVGLLAGGIAHDFNNILTGILGNASLARMLMSSNDKAYKHIGALEAATVRAKELTQHFLAFSKGGAPLRTRVNAAELVQNAVNLALSGLKSNCSLTIPEDLWWLEVDEGQISQVIHNLIRNADQAMPHGGTIHVTCENLDWDGAGAYPLKPGNYVLIGVTDQGIGIPEANLEKIFDPYFTTKEEGRGLGLTTSYAIMKNHEGHISVDSRPRAGSTFNIYLPACAAPVVVDSPQPVDESADIKGKVLIMDDEEVVSMIAGEILEYLGYEVAFARDGEQAIAMYGDALSSNTPFDIVIMDLTVPGGMGGKDAIARLLKMDPAVKAIVSSGYSDDPVMADFRHYGFAGMAPKPYSVESLGKEVRRVLASP